MQAVMDCSYAVRFQVRSSPAVARKTVTDEIVPALPLSVTFPLFPPRRPPRTITTAARASS
jgi:hypothetical protein